MRNYPDPLSPGLVFEAPPSPGPWTFRACDSDPSLFQLLDASGRVIGFMRRGNGSRLEAREFEANARMAAASVTVMELAARVCEEQAKRFTDDRGSYVARECAAAIRANNTEADAPLRYDVLYEIAATFGLDYNEVCRVARSAAAGAPNVG